MLLFTRAIRKSASSMLSAASQLFLLIKWRSLRTLLRSNFRASTESERKRVRVNCNEYFTPVRLHSARSAHPLHPFYGAR